MPTVISELTGEVIDTSSEQHRHECECRWLLTNKPTRSEKHLYLYGVWDRDQLFAFSSASGQMELVEDWQKRIPSNTKCILKMRGLAAADRILEDARRIWESQKT